MYYAESKFFWHKNMTRISSELDFWNKQIENSLKWLKVWALKSNSLDLNLEQTLSDIQNTKKFI